MIKYAKHDVAILEGVYMKMLAWIDNHPAVDRRPERCPKCGSLKLMSHGWTHTKSASYRRYRCRDCNGICRDRLADKDIAKPGIVNG